MMHDILRDFRSNHYNRHNQRRLEHLAALRLPLRQCSVLEVGAGVGDHTEFFIDRDCHVVSTDGRPENVAYLQERFGAHPRVRVTNLDVDAPVLPDEVFDVVYCYGLLYHLSKPNAALAFLAERCRGTFLLESCVSFGSESLENPVQEDRTVASQSIAGMGCRPTRTWIFNQLAEYFPHVYMPVTQPNHEEFPVDWTVNANEGALTRAVFVASRVPICNEFLVSYIPAIQSRH